MIIFPPSISQLYKILPREYKRKLILAGVCVFIMAGVDLISIGSLIPVLLLVLDIGNISQNYYLSIVYQEFGFESNFSFVVAVCIFILLLSLGRTSLNTYMQYMQSKRLFEISRYLSLRLYDLLHSKGFLYIKQHNSHRLINQINAVSTHLIQGYFISFAALVCEFSVVLIILIGLVLFNIYVFLLAFLTFIPISLIYYSYSRSRIKKYGDILFKISPEKNKLLQQSFVGYTDMEMSNSFNECKRSYSKLLKEQNISSVKQSTLNSSLQRVLELAVVCSVVVLVLASQILTLPALGVILGVFVIAIYRILPGIIKGTSYYFTMRSNTFALDILDKMTQTIDEEVSVEQQEITFERSINFNSVCFSYDKIKPVIRNFSLEITKGDFIGIKGASGSGKSTMFHLLLGFLEPDLGSIYIDNTILSAKYMNSWRSKIGYVSQQLFMMEGTLLDNIIMNNNVEPDISRVHEVLKLASLDKFVESLPQGINTAIGEGGCQLSGGQRQRLGIARALYKKVNILMFDEATSSLDEDTEKAIIDAICCLTEQRPDLTIIVISHRQESLAMCSRIIELEHIQN